MKAIQAIEKLKGISETALNANINIDIEAMRTSIKKLETIEFDYSLILELKKRFEGVLRIDMRECAGWYAYHLRVSVDNDRIEIYTNGMDKVRERINALKSRITQLTMTEF